MGYAKKAFDLAIQANKVEEFVSNLKNFIEVTKSDLLSIQDNASFISIKDPLHVPHRGRQPNRYKSSSKPSRKADISALQDSEKKIRWCHKCKQVGHYAPNMPKY
ncbi:7588_t:CDS:2 [Gigaspora rosea]|nr:7588_t:CDS:2 [Gigaspora rosea]